MRGTCRYCSCTDDQACVTEGHFGDLVPCSWLTQKHDVCTNPKCVAKFNAGRSARNLINGSKGRAALRARRRRLCS